jgi:peptidoglycan hydrolase-like protein with peptidoglycan-binding domain
MRLDRFQRSDRQSQSESASGDLRPRASAQERGRRGPSVLMGSLGVLALAVVALGVLALVWSRTTIITDATALARVDTPLTGGTIESVQVTGPSGRPIPISVRNGQLWPRVALAPGELVSIQVVVHRPGWIAWLAGSQDSKQLQLRTPSAHVLNRYVTLAARSPLQLAFNQPVRRLVYGQPEHLERRALAEPRSQITLARDGEAGSIEVAAAPRTWERLPTPSVVSWFPEGAEASAVLSPRPGARILPSTPIYVTFSQPVSSVLGGSLPRLTPAAHGTWHGVDSHTIVFRPHGYGFGLDTPVTLALPHTVRLLSGQDAGSSNLATWTVPGGSILRVQQILAQLGYLPLNFSPDHEIPTTAAAQESAAIDPPTGSFSWRYGDTPGSLHEMWQRGTANTITRGALMAFENAHELTTDGVVGPTVWHALMHAVDADERTTASYTYVTVNESSQSLQVWNDGSVRLKTPVNTGIAAAPTELGTFPVYEHIASGTMSGTNPDGSHYEDPGIPWISYFNGGDALHGFERAQYGFPQSLGCVEMEPATAGKVWPYTPIGTLVHVE